MYYNIENFEQFLLIKFLQRKGKTSVFNTIMMLRLKHLYIFPEFLSKQIYVRKEKEVYLWKSCSHVLSSHESSYDTKIRSLKLFMHLGDALILVLWVAKHVTFFFSLGKLKAYSWRNFDLQIAAELCTSALNFQDFQL